MPPLGQLGNWAGQLERFNMTIQGRAIDRGEVGIPCDVVARSSHIVSLVWALPEQPENEDDEQIEKPSEAEEAMEAEEAAEEIVETHTGRLVEEGVLIESPGSLVELDYGFPNDGGLLVPDVAAFHLQRRGVLQIVDGGKEVSFETILNRGLSSDQSFFLKYLVYRDMRSKGRRLKAGTGEMPYLWFFEKPGRPCTHMVAAYSRNQSIPLSELEGVLAIAGRFKKGVYLALVDEEGEVSYYEMKRFTTRPASRYSPDRKDAAQIVGPMAVVWDPLGALSLYREGYFGKPIGIRKPRSMDFEKPIMLSFTELLYLAGAGRVSLAGSEGEVGVAQLAKSALSEPNFRERYAVYRKLKGSGLIVKSGMKFGVDFAVYEYGPGLDHAPFMIHVYPSASSITPTEIVRAGRLAASVKKKFVVAQVDAKDGRVRMISFARAKP